MIEDMMILKIVTEDMMILKIVTVLLTICAFLEIFRVKFLSSDYLMAKIADQVILFIMFTLMFVCLALGIILLLNAISDIDMSNGISKNYASNRNFVAYYDPATKTVRYRSR